MRNYFAIAFIIVYLILTVGVAKTTHYCMGRLNSSSLFSFNSKKCPCALFQSEPSSCCHDESEIIKIEDDQQIQFSTQAKSPSFFLIELIKFNTSLELPIHNQSLIAFSTFDLPLVPQIPIYKRNCAFTFYTEGDLI